MNPRLTGDLILLFITFCWGVTFPLIENAVDVVDPSVFVTVRFFCAALFLLPFVFKSLTKDTKKVLLAGVILGALNATTYIAQTIGLQTVNSAEAAFITGVSVVMVPFILPFFSLGKPSNKDVLGSLLCFFGLFFLVGYDFSHVNMGHIWVLLCAVSNAFTIVYLQKVTKQAISFSLLAFYQILFAAIFSTFFTVGKSYAPMLQTDVLVAMLFCALFATALTLYLQTKFQHYTTASRAAMIYCFEPVFASIAGYFVNHEIVGWQVFLGGACIFMGLIVSIRFSVNK